MRQIVGRLAMNVADKLYVVPIAYAFDGSFIYAHSRDGMKIKMMRKSAKVEIKQLVVDDKWMASVERSVKTEMERISQRLTQRIKELAERYETPLPKQTKEVKLLEDNVIGHLEKMGFAIETL
jgi:nitroimidazol reductase NimA-like FMN-containing flavoprotein (pyridoxamine 5'-phosphate oxidase superfamily)